MAVDLAHMSGVEPVRPRCKNRMMIQANAPSISAHQHYYRNVYLPLLDHIKTELEYNHWQIKTVAAIAIVTVSLEKKFQKCTLNDQSIYMCL
jgi:hypothetical protein